MLQGLKDEDIQVNGYYLHNVAPEFDEYLSNSLELIKVLDLVKGDNNKIEVVFYSIIDIHTDEVIGFSYDKLSSFYKRPTEKCIIDLFNEYQLLRCTKLNKIENILVEMFKVDNTPCSIFILSDRVNELADDPIAHSDIVDTISRNKAFFRRGGLLGLDINLSDEAWEFCTKGDNSNLCS
ncbi:hypothetical protein D3C81_10930 [compost metagenome]